MSIPASNIVQVVPSVLSAGGNPLALNGLILSNSPNLPVGAPIGFSSPAAVLAYFGSYAWAGTATCSGSTLTIVSTTLGTAGNYAPLAVGQGIQGLLATGCPPGTYITAMGTYSTTTGTGTVTINTTWTQASAQAITSNSLEYNMAQIYFQGYTLGTLKPTQLWFSRYAQTALQGFFRGAPVPTTTTLATLQAITTGTLTMTLNGAAVTVAATNLSSATSLSNAGVVLAAQLVTGGAPAGTTCTYNSLFNAFVIQSGTTGIGAVTVCGGTSAAIAQMGLGSGVTSLGTTSAMTPAAAMATVVLGTQNWACFTSAFEPVIADKIAFSAWTNGTGGQFVYAPYDSDTTIVTTGQGAGGSVSCISYWCSQRTGGFNYNGTCSQYQDPLASAFVLGFVASINWAAPGGRAAIQAKQTTGVSATISDPTSYANAIYNNTNFFGAFATANYPFTIFTNGSISGPFAWLDSYVSAIWLNAAIQLAEVNNMLIQQSIPYNATGYNMIESAACSGPSSPVQMALVNGVINKGVLLTAAQASAVNTAASVNAQNPNQGINVASILPTTGYYFQVGVASGTARMNRTSPPCTLWYMDGGSVNQLNVASINIQ
jgi:hypothetical protein